MKPLTHFSIPMPDEHRDHVGPRDDLRIEPEPCDAPVGLRHELGTDPSRPAEGSAQTRQGAR